MHKWLYYSNKGDDKNVMLKCEKKSLKNNNENIHLGKGY